MKSVLPWQIQDTCLLFSLISATCRAVNTGNRFSKNLQVSNKNVTEFIKNMIYFRNSEPYSNVLMGKNKLEKREQLFMFFVQRF